MLTAEAHVQTERPSRYLVHLCRHAGHMGQHRPHRPRTHDGDDTHAPPEVQHVEWSDTYGIVKVNWGQWILHAIPDTLILRAEATNEKDLQRIQDLLGRRLEKIGRRDHLRVTWQRSDAPTDQPGDTDQAEDPRPTDESQRTKNTPRRWSLARRWAFVAVVVLLVAVHLGLGGAALAASRWTDWTAIGLVALFIVKVIGLRLLAIRRDTVAEVSRHVVAGTLRNHLSHKRPAEPANASSTAVRGSAGPELTARRRRPR